jgi:hypothetical protein
MNNLAQNVLAWWEDHQYDTTADGEYNLYSETPGFVKLAQATPAIDITQPNMLKDTLHYTSAEVVESGPASFANTQISRGVLVGVMGAFMALGLDFEQAVELTCEYLPPPTNFYRGCVPGVWTEAFFKRIYAKY